MVSAFMPGMPEFHLTQIHIWNLEGPAWLGFQYKSVGSKSPTKKKNRTNRHHLKPSPVSMHTELLEFMK